MSSSEPIGHDELDRVAARLRLAIDASELHGSLCGFLAAGGRLGKRPLLDVLELNGDGLVAQGEDLAVLNALVAQSEAELDDPELGFEPILPPDDRPLSERAEALIDWCRGFLGGFGLGGPNVNDRLSDEAKEVLRDIGAIAASELDFGEETDDEDALIEIHEFVRVGAMLLFTEARVASRSSSDTLH